MSVEPCGLCGKWPADSIQKLLNALMKGDSLTTEQLMALQRDHHPEEFCSCFDYPIPSRTHPCAVNWCCSKPRWFQ
jgi:hypothetical protein